MDVAYDHIQEEVLSPDEIARKEASEKHKQSNLNTEFQEAYKSFSATPWGAKLGGFFSDVKKHGETYYEGARQQGTVAGGEALKGFTDLRTNIVNRARSLSKGQGSQSTPHAGAWDDETEEEGENKDHPQDQAKDQTKERTESEALRESEGVISRFRVEAAKRLKDLEKAEEAADAAIFKFGANIGNFLRDAVKIAPPTDETNKDGSRKILFESKDQDGKRVIHTTRFDAQLHAIHASLESFTNDPISPEYQKWKDDFDVEKKTDAIAKDLEKYEELRRTMEKLVPEKVEYPVFWTRYYFLRMVVETEEQRRREMLKGGPTLVYEDGYTFANSIQELLMILPKTSAGTTTPRTRKLLPHINARCQWPLSKILTFQQPPNPHLQPYTNPARRSPKHHHSSLQNHVARKKAVMPAMTWSVGLLAGRLAVRKKRKARVMKKRRKRTGSNVSVESFRRQAWVYRLGVLAWRWVYVRAALGCSSNATGIHLK